MPSASEASLRGNEETLRCAQGDRDGAQGDTCQDDCGGVLVLDHTVLGGGGRVLGQYSLLKDPLVSLEGEASALILTCIVQLQHRVACGPVPGVKLGSDEPGQVGIRRLRADSEASGAPFVAPMDQTRPGVPGSRRFQKATGPLFGGCAAEPAPSMCL